MSDNSVTHAEASPSSSNGIAATLHLVTPPKPMQYLQVPPAKHVWPLHAREQRRVSCSSSRCSTPSSPAIVRIPTPISTPPPTSASSYQNSIHESLGSTPLNVKFGYKEQRVMCPHCGKMMLTTIQPKCTYLTHSVAILMCLLGAWCFVMMPYCMNTCKKLNHYCSQCGEYLGHCEM